MNDARTPSVLHRGGLLLAALAPALAGCRIAAPEVNTEADIALATGFADAVRFRVEGDALDAPAGTGDEERLGLADALQRALATDPALQAALARVRAAQAEAELAGLLPNPILDLVLRFPEGGGKTSIEAGLAADLLAILARPRRASAAGHRLRRESALALATALDLVADVQERYAAAQALEALVPVLAQRVELLARLREVAAARLAAGEGTRQEVTTLDSERAELALELARRRRDLRAARLALARRTGEPSGAASWALEPWGAPAAFSSPDEPAWLAAALAARPEILALEWEIRAREDDEALAGGRELEGAALGLAAERESETSLGPSLSIPLPLVDHAGPRRARAAALTSAARHRLTAARRRAVEDVRTALLELDGARADRERVVAELLPLERRRRDEVEQAYRAGQVDVSALLLAEQSLQGVEARRIELEHELSSARVRLERAVGGPSAFQAVLASQGGTP